MQELTPIELRYYEIRFHRLVQRYVHVHSKARIVDFIEFLCFLSGANVISITQAVSRSLSEDREYRPTKFEIVLTYSVVGKQSVSQIRDTLPVSPNTVILWLRQYESGDIVIRNRFPLEQSRAIAQSIQFLDSLNP